MAKRKKQSKVKKSKATIARAKARKPSKAAKATKRTVAKTKPKPAPVKKAAPKVKQPVAPVVETVAAEVIEQPAPVTVSEVSRRYVKRAKRRWATTTKSARGFVGWRSRMRDVSCADYLSLADWPSRQARNAAAACSRSSALLSLRRGRFGGRPMTGGVSPLISSTPCRRIRSRLLIRDQLKPRPITHSFKHTPYRTATRPAAGALLGSISDF